MPTNESICEQASEASQPTLPARQSMAAVAGRRLLWGLRMAQVRLRFLLVLGAAFLIIGKWQALRDVWDRMTAPAAQSKLGAAVSSDTEYFCPMCPGVVSDWPNKCSVCNMPLVRRRKGQAVQLPDGVLSRMQFSPYRVQLAGIRTSPVEFLPLAREIHVRGSVQRSPPSAPSDAGADAHVETAAASRDAAAAIEIEISEQDIPFVSPGATIRATSDAYPGHPPWRGEVTAVEHEVSRRTQRVKVQLAADDPGRELWPGMLVDVRIERLAAELEPFRSQPADPPPRTPNQPRELFVCPPAGQVLAVPETAVLDAGGRRVVYLERMPGMFDCVEVVIGARCGGFYPVISGVARGQRVATAGAFLIDAESRLNPSVAAGYFGAARRDAGVSAPEKPTPAGDAKGASDADAEEIRQALAQLRPAERLAAERQKSCPVTGMLLGSMGAPIKTKLAGREIWLCCEGCQAAAEKEPRKYLGKPSGLAKP